MDRALRVASALAVVAMGVPPAFEIAVLGQPNQRALAAILFGLGAFVGVYSAIRRWPLGLRATTVAYGIFGIGFGLFVSEKPVAFLLAYVVGLLGMNVLAYHALAFGPVLAAFPEEDAVARRARGIAMRSLAVSGGVLALSYGISLALLPIFALNVGSRDPVIALVTAIAFLSAILLLALLPEVPRDFFSRVRTLLR